MTEAVRIITEQVRLRVRREGVDLSADSALVEQYVRDELRRYSERALGGLAPMIADEHQATREVVAALTGFGVLQPFLDDPDIEESCFV
jgi:pilus assembly protein CpaF